MNPSPPSQEASLTPFNFADDNTHALRNPHLPQQHPRSLRPVTDTEQLSRSTKAAAKKENHARAVDAYDTLLISHNTKMEELAKAHALDSEYIKKLHAGNPHFKLKRDVNLANAKVHKKAKEVNSSLPMGERKTLLEIRQLVHEDPTYQNLSNEQEEEMKGEVRKARQHKKLGARLTNKSAAQDYRDGVSELDRMIAGISSRTGASIVAFSSRSNLEDTYQPNWLCSTNASNFTTDTFGITMWEGSRLLEQWSCAKSKNRNPGSLAAMRIECSTIINGGLKTAAQSRQAQMNYANYDTQIIQRHGVKLVGWTFDKVISPNDIYTINDVRILLKALQCGTCHWIRLSKLEITNHAKEMTAREVAGETIGKKRKGRADAGVKRGPRKGAKTADGQTAAVRAAAALSQLPPTQS
ncbi:hypothetical protein BJ912DRAFT_1068484 [Pholiota molesta]|nr:hypothetical protein BJ912DRAFT_1068484 [Pholiota molesta]